MLLSFVGLLRGLSHILRSAIIAKGKSRVIFVSTLVEVVFSLPLMYVLMQDLFHGKSNHAPSQIKMLVDGHLAYAALYDSKTTVVVLK
mgnify:CR=1 FL=1